MFVWRKHYSQFVTYFDVKLRIYITFLLFCDYGWAENLYDVFVNIRDDEAEHCKTMRACQTLGSLRSPHSILEDDDTEEESGCVVPEEAHCEGIVDCLKKSITS